MSGAESIQVPSLTATLNSPELGLWVHSRNRLRQRAAGGPFGAAFLPVSGG